MAKFSKKSLDKLSTCDSDLVRLFNEVIKDYDCTVLEGHRSMERQKALFSEGKTKTLGSKHLFFPSQAVDIMPYPVEWDDELGQHKFATRVYRKAMELGISVKWGGNFKGFYDSPHWELIDDVD